MAELEEARATLKEYEQNVPEELMKRLETSTNNLADTQRQLVDTQRQFAEAQERAAAAETERDLL